MSDNQDERRADRPYRIDGRTDRPSTDEDRIPADVDPAAGPEMPGSETPGEVDDSSLSEGSRDAAAGTEDQAIEEVLLEEGTGSVTPGGAGEPRRAGEAATPRGRQERRRDSEASGPAARGQDIHAARETDRPDDEGGDGDDIDQLRAERDKYLRALADAQNRLRREQEQGKQAVERANQHFLEQLLPVVDGFERAMGVLHQGADADALREGMALLERRLQTFLEEAGIEAIACDPGDEFDPEIHEAMMRSPNSDDTIPEGHISAVLERGWRLHGRVVRPVRVAVAGPSLDVEA